MEHIQYPKWLYHQTQPPVIVNNEEEHRDLGPEWSDSPDSPPVAEEKPEEKKVKPSAHRK